MAASYTALIPNSILLLRQMQKINNKTPITISMLPIQIKVSVDKVDRFVAKN